MALVLVLFTIEVAGHPSTPLEVSFGDAVSPRWHLHRKPEHCELVHRLDSYGEARFVAQAGEAMLFELQIKKDWQARGMLHVSRVAPPWHPAAPQRRALGHVRHIVGAGGTAAGEVVLKMMNALRNGHGLVIQATSSFDEASRVSLKLSPTGFGTAFEKLTDCVREYLPISWQAMARTRVQFPVDTDTLSPRAREQLDRLAAYVREDETVATIYIDGHTDNSGTELGNYQLSKRRAETVQAYLQAQGLAQRSFVVRYHGASYPVAPNRHRRGKARNRRTTVRLERTQPAEVAAN